MDEPLNDAYETEDENPDAEIAEFLSKARQEFAMDRDADRDNRLEAYDDLRFIADPYSQWLEDDRQTREETGRPCPVLNRLQPFLKQITNDIRLNKPMIEVKPVETDDRTKADLREGVIRHVENASQAKYVYAKWAEDGVECGIGHVRGAIVPERGRPDQRGIRIETIQDPLSVIWDRSSVARDRSDARRCWVIDYLPKDDIDAEYEGAVGEWPDEEEATAWSDWNDTETDEVRVVEYYCIKNTKYRTFAQKDPLTGEMQQFEVSEHEEGFEPQDEFVQPISETRKREVRMWIMTAGKVLVGGKEGVLLPGDRIPIFPYIASEKRVGRRVIRKGLVRDAKDSVRLQNWATALLVEAMAASPKPKWVGPTEAFEGLEREWDAAATSAKPWIPYNAQAGGQAPQYVQPPVFNAGLVEAMNVFDENIKRVTGLYDASMGARSNETSGRAIVARERQGDTATFDYIDNFLMALESLGRWLVDVIPAVYNDERTIRIVGRNDEERLVTINQQDDLGNVQNELDFGVYDVVVKAGPAFSTRREEAAAQLMEIARSAPDIAPILIDMIVENMDWPNAEKLKSRLQLMLPPQIQMMEGIQAPQMPAPPPDPKIVAGAEKDAAQARKTNAEAVRTELENMIAQIMAGIPPQPQFAAGNGPPGQGAPPMGGMNGPGFPPPA